MSEKRLLENGKRSERSDEDGDMTHEDTRDERLAKVSGNSTTNPHDIRMRMRRRRGSAARAVQTSLPK